jgi:hypothetical protein
MSALRIRKLDLDGREVFSYPGALLARTENSVTVEAFFERYERLDLGYTVFERGDRFVERFYADRWYNVFEVYSAGTGRLRGWYCNIARPARITAEQVSQVDLALDVWVNPDGSALVLDEDEFAALPLTPEEREAARAAAAEIQALAAQRRAPFSGALSHGTGVP